MTFDRPFQIYRPWAALTVAVSLVALSGCGAMQAQNPSGSYKPVNAVADNPEQRLFLKGADVTAYFTQGAYVQGKPEFRSTYEGVDFRFASALLGWPAPYADAEPGYVAQSITGFAV